jgi:hypothetical protein
MSRLIISVGLLALAMPAFAADKQRITAAIKKGGEYLKQAHAPKQGYDGGSHHAGTAALAGLGMLEAGIPTNDISVQNVTNYIRSAALSQTETYHTALCILYLDRLGDPADVPVIQMLGVRLYGGMTPNGGWTYHCWEQVPQDEVIRLQQILQKDVGAAKPAPRKPNTESGKDDGFLKPADTNKLDSKLHPEVAKTFAAVKQVISARGRGGAGGVQGDDNSNTQFGLIGLWIASRHGLPAKDAFALIEARYLQSQNRADGGWSYNSGSGGPSTVAMTCAGLLGLAVGNASRAPKAVVEPADKDKKSEDPNDPFFNPKTADGEKAEPAVRPKASAQSPAATAGLKAVAAFLAAQQRGARNASSLQQFIGAGNSLYMLWSIERMAVAYNLDTIGGIDWYDWGSDVILSMQQSSGAFNDGSYGEDVNTAFAILFLAKANFTKDLSAKTKGRDPGVVELRGGGASAAPLQAPPSANAGKNRSAATAEAFQDPRMKGGFSLPKLEQPTEAGEAEKVAKGITGATSDADFTAKVNEARDTKGAKWTKGLVLASARLDGDRRIKAREALADRLTRMTPKTLRDMLRDSEAELRRAACLACAMRDEVQFIPDLIERITDPSDLVVRAARAGLVSFANTDFGPKTANDEDAKVRAANAWNGWYETKYGKK